MTAKRWTLKINTEDSSALRDAKKTVAQLAAQIYGNGNGLSVNESLDRALEIFDKSCSRVEAGKLK